MDEAGAVEWGWLMVADKRDAPRPSPATFSAPGGADHVTAFLAMIECF